MKLVSYKAKFIDPTYQPANPRYRLVGSFKEIL